MFEKSIEKGIFPDALEIARVTPLFKRGNNVSNDPIMFADDTNLFYEHKDLKTLFSLVNQELQKGNE